MKKLCLLVLFFVFCTIGKVEAQTYKYYSTELAYKYQTDYGGWSNWTDWESCHCLITISLDRDVINIYSSEPQEFDIYDSTGEWERDADGGEQLLLKCVDAHGLRCTIRIRAQRNGVLQLYVDYSDFRYVYNIERRN